MWQERIEGSHEEHSRVLEEKAEKRGIMLGVGAFCVRVLEGEERKEMAEQEGKKRFCRKNLSASWRVGGKKVHK